MRFFSLFIAISLLLSSFRFITQDHTSDNASSELSGFTVVIDAGHGGEDGGASTYGGMHEKELNLLISSELYTLLSFAGINTVMTRREDVLLYDKNSDYKGHKKSMDLAARLKMARESEGGILISIHMNAFPETQYHGMQVYYSKNAESSLSLARTVQSKNQELLDPTNSRKIKESGKNIYLLDRFEGTGILIECGFLSNPTDRANLNSADYRKSLATVIFFAVIEYLSDGGR